MDKIQRKIVNLLREIHEVCIKNNISYTLDARLSAMAVTTGNLPTGNINAIVYMTLSDLTAFRNVIDNSPTQERVVEGMDNNPRFPGFFFRYVDTSTTYYNYAWGDTYRYKGISVVIQILRAPCANMPSMRGKERGFMNMSYRYKKWGSLKSKLGRIETAVKMIGGREKYANKLYEFFCKKYMDSGRELKYNLVGMTTKLTTIEYPAYFYRNRQLVSLEGYEFYASAFIPEQYNNVTGGNIDNFIPDVSQAGFWILASDTIPYTQYLTDDKALMNIARKRQSRWLHDQMHGAVVHFINKDWDILKAVSARLDLKAEYMPIRQEIIKDYNNMNFEKLTEMYENYDHVVREHYRTAKMTIYFDRTIWDIYTAVLKYNGNGAIAGKLAKNIPDEWR